MNKWQKQERVAGATINLLLALKQNPLNIWASPFTEKEICRHYTGSSVRPVKIPAEADNWLD